MSAPLTTNNLLRLLQSPKTHIRSLLPPDSGHASGCWSALAEGRSETGRVNLFPAAAEHKTARKYVAKQHSRTLNIRNSAPRGSTLHLRLDPRWNFDDKDETASGLGFNIPACSSRGCKRPPEVCDPHFHLSASQLIRRVPPATKKMTGSY